MAADASEVDEAVNSALEAAFGPNKEYERWVAASSPARAGEQLKTRRLTARTDLQVDGGLG